MKIAEIDWPVFWHALAQQDFCSREHWLARWVFADAEVKLSMRPIPPAMDCFHGVAKPEVAANAS